MPSACSSASRGLPNSVPLQPSGSAHRFTAPSVDELTSRSPTRIAIARMPRQVSGLDFLGLMLISILEAVGEPEDSQNDRRCYFHHPSYAGPCVVVAENDECRDILLYLNDPRSGGKPYCRSTSLRGGGRW